MSISVSISDNFDVSQDRPKTVSLKEWNKILLILSSMKKKLFNISNVKNVLILCPTSKLFDVAQMKFSINFTIYLIIIIYFSCEKNCKFTIFNKKIHTTLI